MAHALKHTHGERPVVLAAELLYSINLWLIPLVMMILLLVATEAGFRAERKVRSRLEETAKSQVGIISGAVLGLLALLLGFTFSMSQNRFALRQGLVMEEANDIGTTYELACCRNRIRRKQQTCCAVMFRHDWISSAPRWMRNS